MMKRRPAGQICWDNDNNMLTYNEKRLLRGFA